MPGRQDFILLRQMRRDLSAYLDKHQDHPSVRRFAEEDRELILEHLESEVERSTRALLGESSMQVTAETRAIPKGDSFLIEDAKVECGQTMGFTFRRLFGDGGDELLKNDRESFVRRAIAVSSDQKCTIAGEARIAFKERFEIAVGEH